MFARLHNSTVTVLLHMHIMSSSVKVLHTTCIQWQLVVNSACCQVQGLHAAKLLTLSLQMVG